MPAAANGHSIAREMLADYHNLADMSERAMQKIIDELHQQLMDNSALTSLHMGVLKRDEMDALYDLREEAHGRTQA